jgi:hypothetical protein
MADANVTPTPWRVLVLRTNYHVANARLLLDLTLESKGVCEPIATQLVAIGNELHDAQEHLQSMAQMPRGPL